jgi:hypothetical protein|nr:MAG TPA: Putative binding domain, N-terminal [Caudoviricetes sp.]
MAVDFEISSLSGTGTATIRVKPKAVNTEQTLKEQVLKVVVQGVEREVTLIQQKAAPKVETWGTYFSITPETTSHTFEGTKKGETLEIGVYSYQQKFINNEPQDEYRAVDWKVESSSDWLEVTQEIGEANAAGKLTIKTKSTNQEHNPSNYDPLERTAIVKIISQQEPNTEIVLNITQSPGTRTTKYGFEPTPNIPFPNPGQNISTAQISNVKGYRYYLINGIQVAKFIKQFKITDISKTIEGQFPGGIGFEPIPFKVWLTDYPSNIATQWVSELNCVGHLQTIMSGFGGIQVIYNGYINDNGNQSVQLNIRLGL